MAIASNANALVTTTPPAIQELSELDKDLQTSLTGINSAKDVLGIEFGELDYKDDIVTSDREKEKLKEEIDSAKDFLREISKLGDGREREETAMIFLEKFLNQKYFKQIMYTGSAQSSVLLRRVTRQYRPNQERLNRKPLGAMSSTLLLSYLIDRFKACQDGSIKLSCYRHNKYWLVCTADFVSHRKLGISLRSFESAIRILKDLNLIETCPGIEYGRRQNRIWLNIETLTVKLIDSFVEYASEKKRNYSEAIASQSLIKSQLNHLERSLSLDIPESDRLNDLNPDLDLKIEQLSELSKRATDREDALLADSKIGFNLELGLLTAIKTKSSIYINKLFNKDNKSGKITQKTNIKPKLKNNLTIDINKDINQDISQDIEARQRNLERIDPVANTFIPSVASSSSKETKPFVARGRLSFVNNSSYLEVESDMRFSNNYKYKDEGENKPSRPLEMGYDPNDPELIGRSWNRFKGTYKSHARDEWMVSNYKIDPEFFKWCENYKRETFGKPVDKPNLQAEIRNNFVRAGDLWCGYQSELEEEKLKIEKEKAIANGEFEVLGTRVDGRKYTGETWKQREEFMRERDRICREWQRQEHEQNLSPDETIDRTAKHTSTSTAASTVSTVVSTVSTCQTEIVNNAVNELDEKLDKFAQDLKIYLKQEIISQQQYDIAIASKTEKINKKKQKLRSD